MKLLLCCCVLVLVALFSSASAEEELVRVAHYEPVFDFTVNTAKDYLHFRAYGKEWRFAIWVSGVSDSDEDNADHFFGRFLGTNTDVKLASFTLGENDYITGQIITGNDTFWLEAKDPAKPKELFMHRSSDVWFHPSVKLHCEHPGEHQHRADEDESVVEEHDRRRVLSALFYRDQYWLSATKNPSWYTGAGTLGLLNDVNAIYSAYGLSTWSFSSGGQLRNSWTTQGALNSMLTYVSNYANNAGVSARYNSVAWLVGNNVGGLAWLSSACGRYGNYYKTSVSGLAYWSRLWTVKTIAHELGHNRGANHDFANQCASNQASGCQCSVMSYCFPSASTAGGAKNYFSSKSLTEIRSVCP